MPVDYVAELVSILDRLRGPGGCPWDMEQTHASLIRYLVEEAGEFQDAVDDGDDAGMIDELGDLLLQIVFHCRIGAEGGRFDLQAVARSECEKMVRRHPHVFGEAAAQTPADVVDRWDRIKREEKGGGPAESAVAGVPRHLPALHRAEKMQGKVAKVGFEWPDAEGALAKVEEEVDEVRRALAARDDAALAEEIGDLLFAVVNLARMRALRAEGVLHDSIRKFERRFRTLEHLAAESGRTPEACSLEELKNLWEAAKRG